MGKRKLVVNFPPINESQKEYIRSLAGSSLKWVCTPSAGVDHFSKCSFIYFIV